jgi:hypothetical protein
MNAEASKGSATLPSPGYAPKKSGMEVTLCDAMSHFLPCDGNQLLLAYCGPYCPREYIFFNLALHGLRLKVTLSEYIRQGEHGDATEDSR